MKEVLSCVLLLSKAQPWQTSRRVWPLHLLELPKDPWLPRRSQLSHSCANTSQKDLDYTFTCHIYHFIIQKRITAGNPNLVAWLKALRYSPDLREKEEKGRGRKRRQFLTLFSEKVSELYVHSDASLLNTRSITYILLRMLTPVTGKFYNVALSPWRIM